VAIVVKVVMNLPVRNSAGNFVTNCGSLSFAQNTLLLGVCFFFCYIGR